MRIATFTLGTSARTRRVTSIPDTPGMRTSINTRSGTSSTMQLDRVEPVAGLADDFDVGLVLEHEPHTTPEQRVRVGEQYPYRRLDRNSRVIQSPR